MFRIFLLSIILLLSGIVYGQRYSQKTLSSDDEYSLWLSESLSKLSTQLNLVQLNDINQGLHYRIWFEGQVIDINRDSENSVEGTLTNFANTASDMQNYKVDDHSINKKINSYEVEQLFVIFFDKKGKIQNVVCEIQNGAIYGDDLKVIL